MSRRRPRSTRRDPRRCQAMYGLGFQALLGHCRRLAAGNDAISRHSIRLQRVLVMPDQPKPRRPQAAALPPQGGNACPAEGSDNPINGPGETTPRRASPFFRHPPPDPHPYGELQYVARQSSRKCPDRCAGLSPRLQLSRTGSGGRGAERSANRPFQPPTGRPSACQFCPSQQP